MTVAEILARVEVVRALARDDEAAHGEEDRLREKVLEAIAKGDHAEPADALARAVLKTSDIDFARWCA